MDVLPFLIRSSAGCPEPATVRALRAGVTLPPAFDAWFARATAVDPASRYRTASETVSALGFALGVSHVAPLVAGQGIVPSPLSTSGAFGAGATPSSATLSHATAALSVGPARPIRWSVVAAAAIAGLTFAAGVLYAVRATRSGGDPADASAAAEPAAPRAAEPIGTATAVASATPIEVAPARTVAAQETPATLASSARPATSASASAIAAPTTPSSFNASTASVARPSASTRPRPRGEGLF